MCIFVPLSSPTHLIAKHYVYLALRDPYNNIAAINIRHQEATIAIIQKLYTVRVLTTHPPTPYILRVQL